MTSLPWMGRWPGLPTGFRACKLREEASTFVDLGCVGQKTTIKMKNGRSAPREKKRERPFTLEGSQNYSLVTVRRNWTWSHPPVRIFLPA
jgi:hypothetical protein